MLCCWKQTDEDLDGDHQDFGTALLLAVLHDLGQGAFDKNDASGTSGSSGTTTKKQLMNQEVMQPRLW
jgi:hypothetical protein